MNESYKSTYPELDYLEFFTTPFELTQEQINLTNLPKQKYDHVVVIGRFQPLHYGHIYLIKEATVIGKQITIGIGSTNVNNKDNPYTFLQRKYMVEKALRKEGLMNKIKHIVPLKDYSDDKVWIDKTLITIGKVDAVVGNNDWVNECFELRYIPFIPVPLLQRGIYEGKRIRSFLRNIGKL